MRISMRMVDALCRAGSWSGCVLRRVRVEVIRSCVGATAPGWLVRIATVRNYSGRVCLLDRRSNSVWVLFAELTCYELRLLRTR